MNPFLLSGIFTGVTTLAFGLFVFLHDPKRKLYRLWLLFTFSVAIWGFSSVFIAISQDENFSVFLWRFSVGFGVVWIPVFFLHFVYEFCGVAKRNLLLIVYPVNCLFALLSFHKDFFVKGRYVFNSFYYGVPGKYFILYFIWWFFVFSLSLAILIRLRRSFDKHKQNQISYTFVAIAIGAIGGTLNHLPVFGINLYPWSNFAIPFYPMIMSIAIIRHQLMDIEVVIRRATVFAGLFAFVYGVFTVVTVVGQEFFRNNLGWNQWVAMVPTVVIITFALRPLEIFLTNTTERFLFQKKYDYRDLLRVFTNEILTFLDIQKLSDKTVGGLISIVKLESAAVLLYDKDLKVYKVTAAENIKDKSMVFEEDHTLVRYLKASHKPILRDKNADKVGGEGDMSLAFKALNSQLCLPILSHDQLVGILSLGMKKSGEEYSDEELDILMTLARTEAIAISNAQLFDELSKTQAEAAQREKMAVIGTLAAGINHEICNPLGIVRGQCEMFLLNARDGFYSDKTPQEIVEIAQEVMNKVIHETDRATAITKKLSSFAKPSKKSALEEIEVEKELDEILGLLGQDLKLNNIDVKRNFPKGYPLISADRKQIQEILFNIIRNAAQAIEKKEGKILVSGFSENGSAIINIADNGSGIPKDKIEQIFHPFYTTKAPGKGTGLGLFIVKQVVERNSGEISVQSELGVGTTFTLKFPVTKHEPALVS